jgi:hypothetical protein
LRPLFAWARFLTIRMTATIKAQKFWIISNLVGIIIYLLVAISTWDLDHHLNGLFLEYGILNLLKPLFIILNSIWLILIIFRFRNSKLVHKLFLLVIIAGFWVGVIGIENHEDNYWHEQAQKELNEYN